MKSIWVIKIWLFAMSLNQHREKIQSNQDDNWNLVLFGLEEEDLDIQLNKNNIAQLDFLMMQERA